MLVPGNDEEASWAAPHRLVLGVCDLQGLRAVVSAALADEADQQSVVLAVAGKAGRDLLDPLVDLPKEGFVVRPAVLRRIHRSMILLNPLAKRERFVGSSGRARS